MQGIECVIIITRERRRSARQTHLADSSQGFSDAHEPGKHLTPKSKLGLLRDTCTGIDRELKENSDALSGVNAELNALRYLLRQDAVSKL